MKNLKNHPSSERGGAAVKFLLVFVFLVLVGNAGIQYIPVAYDGASFKQEMDTAVVKGLAAPGQIKPVDIVQASVRRAASDYNVPNDAFIEIKPVNGVVQAQVIYTKQVAVLPFGIYKYNYEFNHLAKPVGYLMK
ncbi:MAG: hypothetical protein LC730_02525 [Acidobacteria bacterium]|nr:hypothetical protein [Acidobacteriota bacterium]MCA1608318.1 hypothetical protein [Acidobacteriota bacterium]